MPINYEAAKTLIKGLVQKMKSFRGNWEQNDPTADDYIKNRPFYTEIKESKVYILPKNSYKFEVGEYAAVCQGNIYQDVIDDKIYTIEIDNNSFELKCKTLDADPVDLKYFGSLSVFVMATNNCDRATASTMVLEQMGIEDTDDNFCIVTASIPDINEKICMIGVEDVISETHSVAMYSIEDIEKVHKIDSKYLPDMNYLSYNRNQNLTYKQQNAALSNIGDAFYNGVTQIANGHYVNYSAQQWLNDSEKEFARNNIEAISENDVYSDGRTYEYKWDGYVHHYDFLTLKGNSYGKIIDYLPCTVDYDILDCKVVMSDGTIYTNWRIGTNCYVLGGDSLGAIIVKSPGEILTHIIGNTRYGSTAKTIGIYGYSNNGVYVSELSVTFKIPKTGIRVNDVNGTEKIITVETDGCISDSCIPETVARKTDILSPDLSQTDETAADYVKGVIRQESLPEGYPYAETVIDPIVWDGSEREVFFTLDDTFYKISDNVLTVDELIGASVTFNIAVDAPIATVTLTEDDISLFENCISGPDSLFVIALENGITIADITIPESGVYFRSGKPYVSDLRKENVKTIKETFLPRASRVAAGIVSQKDILNTVVNENQITLETGSTLYDDISKLNGMFWFASHNGDNYFVYRSTCYTFTPSGGATEYHGSAHAINMNTNTPVSFNLAFDSNGVTTSIEAKMNIITSPSGKKFQITVDDNGTLTVAEVV